ncbi:MAG: PAS domain S-box protein [Anaerolineae bacterium]|nr:PAS domain S-box protein [Anaerolineae bacterium]
MAESVNAQRALADRMEALRLAFGASGDLDPALERAIEGLLSCWRDRSQDGEPCLAPVSDAAQRRLERLEREIESWEREHSLLQTLIAHTHAQLAYLDPDFNFLAVNPAYERGSAYRSEELIGRNHFDLFPHAENLAIFRQVRDTGEPYSVNAKPFEFPNQPDRGVTYWDWTLSPVKDAQGEVIGLVLSLIDCTEIERVRQMRDRLADIVETTPDMIASATLEGLVTYLNPAARRLMDLPETGSIENYTIPDSHPDWAARLIREEGIPTALREGIWQGDTALVDGSGREIPVVQVIIAHRDAQGQPSHLSTIVRDMRAEIEMRAEQARLIDELAAERARLQAIIENAPEGIVVADRQGRIVLANPSAEALYAHAMPPGSDVSSYAHACYPDGRPYSGQDLPLSQAAMAGETTRNVELIVVLPGGAHRHLLASAGPIRSQSGELQGGVTVFQDITDQVLLRQRLERYLEHMRWQHRVDQAILEARGIEETVDTALEHLAGLLPLHYADVSLFDWQARELSLVAVRPSRGHGLVSGSRLRVETDWPIAVWQAGSSTVSALPAAGSSWLPIESLQAQGVRVVITWPLVADGELLGLMNLGLADREDLSNDVEGLVQGVVSQMAVALQHARLDQTLHEHSEHLEELVERRTRQLRASEERFRGIFTAIPSGVALLGANGAMLASNPAFQELVGLSGEALVEFPLALFEHPDDQAFLRAILAGPLSEDGPSEGELRLVRPDGQMIWVYVTATAIRDPARGRYPLLVVVQDITRRREAEATALQAEKLNTVGRLSALLRHEINNPLQVVMGCLELAQEALQAGWDAQRYLDVALEEIRRAASIVSRLRDLSHPGEELVREPTDLRQIVDHLLVLIAKRCEERGVQVHWARPESELLLWLSRDAIQQVLLNLVLNALDAMPEGGRLALSTVTTDDPPGVSLRISDTGVGMTPEQRAQLFEPFHTTKPDGLGLGLYVTRQLIEKHEGRIDVESRVGQGTTFAIWFPAAPSTD